MVNQCEQCHHHSHAHTRTPIAHPSPSDHWSSTPSTPSPWGQGSCARVQPRAHQVGDDIVALLLQPHQDAGGVEPPAVGKDHCALGLSHGAAKAKEKGGQMPPAPTAAIRKDQLKQEPSQAAGSQGGAEGKRKSHSTVTRARLWLPARENTLPVLQPVHPVVAGQQRRPGQPEGLLCSYLFPVQAAPAPPAPRSARALQCWGAFRSSSQLSALLWQDPARLQSAATGSAPSAHQAGGLGSIPQSPAQPQV